MRSAGLGGHKDPLLSVQVSRATRELETTLGMAHRVSSAGRRHCIPLMLDKEAGAWTDKAIISLVHLYVLITQFTIAGRARLLIKVTLISDYLNSINLIFDAIRRAQNPGPLSLYECY